MKVVPLAVAAVALALGATPAVSTDYAVARMMNKKGKVIGVVSFVQGPRGVLVSANLGNLPEGTHGFHIHETGSCADGFKAAGGHFNPDGKGHGFLEDGGHHAGDLPNLQVLANGEATSDHFAVGITLDGGAANSVFDADGSAVIIHDMPDGYTDPAGAGARIACGVIETN